jgi:hypothetical protein
MGARVWHSAVPNKKEAPPVSRRGPCQTARIIGSLSCSKRRDSRRRHRSSLRHWTRSSLRLSASQLLQSKADISLFSPGKIFVNPRLRKHVRSAPAFCAEPDAMGENQIRGGGVGGRSIRADAVASWIAKMWPLKRGAGNLSEIGQKSISVEHETVQQLLGCDSCRHRS